MDDRREVGPYRLLSLLGRGGMAEVWAASLRGPSRFSKEVALKLIRAQNIESQTVMMFVDEARAAASLDHPAIVRTFDLGRADDVAFIAMELVRGPSLNALLSKLKEIRAPMPAAIIAHIGERIAAALDYAFHRAALDGRRLELVHRDVSPQNVLIDAHGAVRLSDFGIARTAIQHHLSKAGTLRGKPGYMSPEQVRGLPLDDRSDLFSLGIVLHECVTLERLFGRKSIEASIAAVITHEPPLLSEEVPGFPEPLARIIEQLLAKDPGERFASAGEAARAFAEVGRTLPGAATVTRDLEAMIGERFGPNAFDLDLTRLVESPLIDAPAESAEPTPRLLPEASFTAPQVSAFVPPPRRRRLLPIALAFFAIMAISATVAVSWMQRGNETVLLLEAPSNKAEAPILRQRPTAEQIDEPPAPVIEKPLVIEKRAPAKMKIEPAIATAPVLTPAQREEQAWAAIRALEATDRERAQKLSASFVEAKASGDPERMARLIEEVEKIAAGAP